MTTNIIENEINELRKIKQTWSRTRIDKSLVRDLVTSIGLFEHTFSVKFPNAEKYFLKNKIAEIAITDGKSELDYFANSKLKVKDNHYFYAGINNITRGIQTIISSLEKEIEINPKSD